MRPLLFYCFALPDPAASTASAWAAKFGYDAIIELDVDAQGDVWSGGRAVQIVGGVLDWI